MQDYLELLKQMITIKSISTDKYFKPEITKMINWYSNLFKKHGFTIQIFETESNPVIYAEYQVDKNFETCLIYGHYDVQPADKADGWTSEPFELTEKDGKLIARGIVDNKGQHLIHMASVFNMINEKKLKYNVKFLIEGDEETGGHGVADIVEQNQELFKCDTIMISDGELPYKPVITVSFRGSFNMKIKYKTASNNLHSGLFGGAVPNAAEELMKLVAKINNNEYICQIPEFYKNEATMTDEDIIKAKETDSTKGNMLKQTEIKKYFFEPAGSFTAKTGFKNMITVSGFQSGYTGEGFSNIVPATAEVRLNIRIAANSDPKETIIQIEKFVKENTPDYVSYELEFTDVSYPIKVNIQSEKHQETIKLLQNVYNDTVYLDYCGASIPVVTDFQQLLHIDPLLVSLGNDDCNMHGVNENFDMGLIEKGLEFSKRFFSKQ